MKIKINIISTLKSHRRKGTGIPFNLGVKLKILYHCTMAAYHFLLCPRRKHIVLVCLSVWHKPLTSTITQMSFHLQPQNYTGACILKSSTCQTHLEVTGSKVNTPHLQAWHSFELNARFVGAGYFVLICHLSWSCDKSFHLILSFNQ